MTMHETTSAAMTESLTMIDTTAIDATKHATDGMTAAWRPVTATPEIHRARPFARTLAGALGVALCGAAIWAGSPAVAHAQMTPTPSANPMSSEARMMFAGLKANLVRAAEKMPDDQYGFKATPDVRSFGELVAHVADVQAIACQAVTGGTKALNASAKTTKADLVAALKESVALCDAAYDSVTDANAAQIVKLFKNDRTKIGVLAFNTAHSNEAYGYMSVYLRLKGLVPPSSDKR